MKTLFLNTAIPRQSVSCMLYVTHREVKLWESRKLPKQQKLHFSLQTSLASSQVTQEQNPVCTSDLTHYQPNAMLQAFLPTSQVCKHLGFSWCLCCQWIKSSQQIKPNRFLPEGHTRFAQHADKVFKSQEDFHTLVSTSGWGWLNLLFLCKQGMFSAQEAWAAYWQFSLMLAQGSWQALWGPMRNPMGAFAFVTFRSELPPPCPSKSTVVCVQP